MLLRRLPFVVVTCAVILSSTVRVEAQISSTRNVTTSTTSSWFDAAAWNNGVPNNAGDMATLQLGPNVNATLQLGSSVTLERLAVNGSSSLNLSGTGPLLFRSDGTGELSFELMSQGGAFNTTIATPVSLFDSEPLHVNIGSLATLQWNGAIVSPTGNVIEQGHGTLRFAGNNAGWGGQLTVDGGTVVVPTNTALGNQNGGLTIKGSGAVTLDQSASDPLIFNDGTIHIRNVTLSGPVSLDGPGVIHRPRNPVTTDSRGQSFETVLGPTIISSNISGPGDLAINNESRDPLNLTGQNTYAGQTYIKAGQVFATNGTSLGTSDGGTTVQGGVLTVQASTGDQFRIEGGELRFTAANSAPASPITVLGGNVYFPNVATVSTPVMVASPGGGINATSSSTSWTGGSTGTGSLRVGGNIKVDAPLTHNGDLTLDRAQLNVANSYAGNTFVTNDSTINHPGAFGQSSTIRVTNGALRLNVLPNGAPTYIIERGSLVVPNTLSPVTSAITLGGNGDAVLDGGATFNGPIQLVPQVSSGKNRIPAGTINGRISGDGGVVLGSSGAVVNVNGANDIRGRIEVGGGNVQVNNPTALDLTQTIVPRGRLNLNVPTAGHVITNQDFSEFGTVVFNAPQNYTEPWVVNAGAIEASAQVGMSDLIMLSGQMRGIGTGAFRLDGDMRVFRAAAIEGGIRGDGDIHLFGSSLTLAGDLGNYSGDFHVHTGTLTTDYLASGFTAPTTLNPASDIHVYDGATFAVASSSPPTDPVIHNNIFLHNAHGGGNGSQGALYRPVGNGTYILTGRVDVGDQGSTIAGNVRLSGRLTGHDLTMHAGGLDLITPQNELTGQIRLTGEAALDFSEQGSSHGLSRVVIEQGSTLSFGPSTLPDRLDDASQVVSRGGFISLVSSPSAITRETLGELKLERGFTRVFVSSDHGSQGAGLTINRVTREPGSILKFQQAGFSNDTRILAGLPQNYGIIGPWAVTENGFATLTTTGQIGTQATTSFNDINAAGPQNHVLVSGNQTLATDKTIASLQHNEDGTTRTLDLNGHQLNVLSGGVFRSQVISNGRITAGENGSAELVFHQGFQVSANVVDNSAGGSVGLVVNSASLRLSGNNSYSGGTWVVGSEYYPSTNATLRIESLSAIPANDRVYVDNGVYELQALTSGEVSLAELHLRNGGYVSGSFLAPLKVQQMFLEDGTINAKFSGTGSIIKQTDGAVNLSNSEGAAFTGTVTVRNGNLSLSTGALPKAKFVLEGGELEMTGDGSFAGNVTMNGGAVKAGRFTGILDVQGDSQLVHRGFTLFYGTVKGSGDLTIRGTQTNPFDNYVGFFGNASSYSGNINVESGAFRVGSPSKAGTGIISVQQAGRLILGSNSYSDPPTSIANEIHLYGGTLYSTPPSNLSNLASPSIATGDVVVHDEAFIGALRKGTQAGATVPGLTLAGRLTLLDSSVVHGLSDGRSTVDTGDVALVDITGELRVGADTTWDLLSCSVSISGTVHPLGTHGSIDFVGVRDLLRLKHATFETAPGQSLAVTMNGGSLPLAVRGTGNVLRGNGTLVGDFSVAAGATIAPGASPGILTLDGDTTIGTGGMLSIEMGGTQLGSQYDQLNVLGDATLDGALLNVSLLNGFVPAPDDGFVILRASHIRGMFTNAAQTVAVGNLLLPITYRGDMIILGNAAAVPEPTVVTLVAILFLLGCCAMLRRPLSRVQ